MASSINYSAISKYVDEISSPLMSRAIYDSNLVGSGITVQSGIKFADKLNIIDDNFAFKAADCAWNPADNTIALSQRQITVAALESENYFCVTDFEQYWLGVFMRTAGSNNEVLPVEFTKVYTAQKVAQAQREMEAFFWKASPSGTWGANYNMGTGILEILTNTSASASVVAGGTGSVTQANVLAKVRAMIAQMPINILTADDLRLFVSAADYALIRAALLAENNYHYGIDQAGSPATNKFMFRFPGTDVMVVMTQLPKDYMILGSARNFVLGVDQVSDYATIKFWYDENTDQVRNRIKAKVGSQVYFPSEIVLYKPA